MKSIKEVLIDGTYSLSSTPCPKCGDIIFIVDFGGDKGVVCTDERCGFNLQVVKCEGGE